MISAAITAYSDGATVLTHGLEVAVHGYSNSAIGTHEAAELRVYAPQMVIKEARTWLRNRIELLDTVEGRVWFGYIFELEIYVDGLMRKYSLLPMVNTVWSYYTDASGTAQQTAPATDQSLITQYGEREQVLLLSTANEEFAEAACERFLAEHSSVTVSYAPINPPLAPAQSYAVIRCLGDLSVLDSVYYEGADPISIAVTDSTDYSAGEVLVDGALKKAQSFTNTSSDTWAPLSFSIEVSRYDALFPAQELIIEHCTDSSNTPGAVLETFTIESEDISAVYPDRTTISFTMSGVDSLAPGAKHWLSARANGTGNGFYVWIRAGDAYADGAYAFYDGVSWTVSVDGYDIQFSLVGGWSIDTQLHAILDESLATFPTAGRTFEDVGSFTLPVSRTSATPALDALKELLRAGGANGRRLLVDIPAPGQIRIYEQPAADDTTELYSIDAYTGIYRDAEQRPLIKSLCPVGFWYLPVPADDDDEPQWIERASYDVARKEYRPETKTQRDLYQPGLRER